MSITADEHETLINFDYASRLVIFYTTRKDVYGQLRKRLGYRIDSCTCSEAENAYQVEIPISICRKPWMLLSPERTEEQIERSKEQGRKLAARLKERKDLESSPYDLAEV